MLVITRDFTYNYMYYVFRQLLEYMDGIWMYKLLYICIDYLPGLPMTMTYFVGPYDLLNHKTRSAVPMTLEGG